MAGGGALFDVADEMTIRILVDNGASVGAELRWGGEVFGTATAGRWGSHTVVFGCYKSDTKGRRKDTTEFVRFPHQETLDVPFCALTQGLSL